MYSRKANYEEAVLNLIKLLVSFETENLELIALNASFIDMAYTFLLSVIRINKSRIVFSINFINPNNFFKKKRMMKKVMMNLIKWIK